MAKKRGKKFRAAQEKVGVGKTYGINDAFNLLKDVAYANFDETVDVSVNLGVDPRHADQMVRGSISLPHGIGKTMKIAVFAKGEKAKEAEAAGADIVGSDDLIEKIQGGWLEFDRAIATPDMMAQVSKVGKVLGPRGLMPNPKLGTVTFEVGKAVKEQKLGKIEFRTEKSGIVHAPIGKKSFEANKLAENFLTLMGNLVRMKPSSSKGTYLRRVTISTVMSPGISLDLGEVQKAAEA
jgi:large subunit ribosomal protein L1